MQDYSWKGVADRVIDKRSVDADDVLALRRDVFGDGAVSAGEADLLFEINRACDTIVPEWSAFFAEALVDYAVFQTEPRGYVTEEMARWLMDRIVVDGRLRHFSELDALVRVIEKADRCPPALSAFALGQVRDAALNGHGAARRGRPGVVGVITGDDVDLIRRILYAYGGDGNVAVTRAEAEVLFELNDRTIEADNHPSWSDLFVKAIANSLLSACGYRVPTRQEAMQRAEWLDERGGVGGFFQRMLSANWDSIRGAYAAPEAAERPGAGLDMAEARWLSERIGRDGMFHDNEKALLEMLREDDLDLPPALQTLIDAA